MEPIRPIGRAQEGASPVPAVRRLTPKEREDAARERQKRRRGRAARSAPRAPADEQPRPGGGSLDIRA
jgi:ribosome assembly protein YihI (activator of Der GTPase)